MKQSLKTQKLVRRVEQTIRQMNVDNFGIGGSDNRDWSKVLVDMVLHDRTFYQSWKRLFGD